MNDIKLYSKFQKIIATVFYISIVIVCIITIGGVVYTIADLIMAEGKLELFQDQNLGIQIVIIGALFAGLFVLIIIAIGMSKKGRIFLLKTIFRERLLQSKYKNRRSIQILTICLLISFFAIIIGFIISFMYELFLGISFTFLHNFSDGQLILFYGLLTLMILGLIIGFFYLWHNGYYLIVSLFFKIESPSEEEN